MLDEHSHAVDDASPSAPHSPTRPTRRGPLTAVLVGAVRLYQKYLSGLKSGPSCRFEPSCSAYALGSLQRFGALRGVLLTVIRLSKCGPWHPGGYDPVPPVQRK
ncbi:MULTISPECIES: membrane protein insertion efficiency factor YidD [Corynebacterium]|uniref:membrane protein insertion efficiency factor YidD n=1 Tax=Corynebacterium TaxID=1716 RepID=UPI00124DF1EE|nr:MULTISPECIES: membrane protein insertion efficiency factor YidD [Corynebacterium]